MMAPDPNLHEIKFIFENLREESRDEVMALSGDNFEVIATNLHASGGFKWVGYAGNQPAALIGATELHSGVWGLLGVGTDKWVEIWKPVTRLAKTEMMAKVKEAGAHRAQCLSLATAKSVHRWLRFLGATHEADMPSYGRKGENFILFSWLKEEE